MSNINYMRFPEICNWYTKAIFLVIKGRTATRKSVFDSDLLQVALILPPSHTLTERECKNCCTWHFRPGFTQSLHMIFPRFAVHGWHMVAWFHCCCRTIWSECPELASTCEKLFVHPCKFIESKSFRLDTLNDSKTMTVLCALDD